VKSAISPPADLTLPLAGSTTARTVLSRAIGRLFGDLHDVLRGPIDSKGGSAGVLRARRPIGDEFVRRDIAALSAVLAKTPDRQAALASVLRRPNVGALVRCARTSPADPVLIAELLSTLAVELAVLGVLPGPVRFERGPAKIVSLLGGFVLEHSAGALVISNDAIETASGTRIALGANADLRRPFHTIEGSVLLALEDNNPLAMFEAHPNKSGNRIDLGGHSAEEWCASLRDALVRIAHYLPELRAEHDLFIQQYVPVGYDAEAHLSASYREAIGTIYLGLHPQPMTMTEAVIHEFSHNKLNALFEIDDVLHNAYSPLFKSPVRPDPRPLHGILLAVHAFIPVARLYEAMLEANDPLSSHPSFGGRFDAIKAKNHEGIEVLLEHADPTPAGRALLDELARWDRHFGGDSRAVKELPPD